MKPRTMEGSSSKGSLVARLGLTFQLIGQIFVTPMVAFSLTYLVVFGASEGQLSLSVSMDMLPWIGLASLVYGMTALMLALAFGGFTPLWVVEHGGWRMALGFTRNPHSGAHRAHARRRYASSSHGRLSLLVHDRCTQGHPLWTIRGSLILLAIPFQVALATIPLVLVLVFPDGVVAQNRQLELALLLYGVCLYLFIRLFPGFARRYITLASLARRLLGNTFRVTWAFPVLLLWSMGQISSSIVQRVFGSDMTLNFQFEQNVFEAMISAQSIPETSFLNLLTALAVMPMAAFTTLAVLGGGSASPPEWMRPNVAEVDDAVQDQLDALSASVERLHHQHHQQTMVHEHQHRPAVVQPVMVTTYADVEVEAADEATKDSSTRDESSIVDGLDIDALMGSTNDPQASTPPVSQRTVVEEGVDVPSSPGDVRHDEPVIRGFDMENGP